MCYLLRFGRILNLGRQNLMPRVGGVWVDAEGRRWYQLKSSPPFSLLDFSGPTHQNDMHRLAQCVSVADRRTDAVLVAIGDTGIPLELFA